MNVIVDPTSWVYSVTSRPVCVRAPLTQVAMAVFIRIECPL